MRKQLEAMVPSLAALLGAILTSGLIIALSGHDPLLAFRALFEGAFGSVDGLSEVCVKACPLLFAGLAVAVSFQTGLWNIGAEGQLLIGAVTMTAIAGVVAGLPPAVGLTICLIGAAAGGGLWAGLAGILKRRRNVNEVISTIMLNFVALHLVSYLVQGPLMESSGSYPQTDALAQSLWLPRLLPPHRVHFGIVLGLLTAAAAYVLLYRMRVGYEMRAAGANPQAARVAGINVDRRFLAAVILSGALAGLAGGVEVAGVTRRVYERFSPGWGFTAIAVALLGRLSPFGVVLSALFFGALEAGSGAMQRVAGVSSVLISVIQATVILFLISIERIKRR